MVCIGKIMFQGSLTDIKLPDVIQLLSSSAKTGAFMIKITISLLFMVIVMFPAYAQESVTLLRPAQVFDGEEMHSNWIVLVHGNSILYAGDVAGMPESDVDLTLELEDVKGLCALGVGVSFFPAYPLVAAVVELEEGTRVVSNLVGIEPADVKIGMPVQLSIEDADDSLKLPFFRPVS